LVLEGVVITLVLLLCPSSLACLASPQKSAG
jgi:hypothetical protein